MGARRGVCSVFKHAWNMPAICHMSHFNVKFPPIGMMRSMLIKKRSSKGHSGRVSVPSWVFPAQTGVLAVVFGFFMGFLLASLAHLGISAPS